MKQRSDPRHKHRQELVKGLYAYSFQATPERAGEAKHITEQLPEIDEIIRRNAPEWPLNQINRVDLSILRLAVHELKNSQTPQKVIIDEAVELGKEYGSSSSPKFIDGVLGSCLKEITEPKEQNLE